MGRQAGLGPWLDIFRVRGYFGAMTQLRDLARQAREDVRFVDAVRRSLVSLPGEDGAHEVGAIWPAGAAQARPRHVRLGLVASGGSGALSSLLGVLKACEELKIMPAVMSFASGAALFAYPVAAGKTPQEVADFVLGVDPSGWVDPDWLGMATLLPKQGRGFGGMLRGDRLEKTYRDFLGDVTLGELRIPSYNPVWNIERNRLEYVGSKTHPRLEVAKAVRMAVALPLFFDPVKWNGGYWCDGATVDIFPVSPVLDLEPPCQAVLGVNCFYPPEFRGEDATGWKGRRWSVLDIADQVMTAQHIQLARENLRRLRAEVGTVMMINPVPYAVVRRTGLYFQFLDRSAWPAFMRSGRRAALAALAARPRAGSKRAR